jgi:hypothetical protein
MASGDSNKVDLTDTSPSSYSENHFRTANEMLTKNYATTDEKDLW